MSAVRLESYTCPVNVRYCLIEIAINLASRDNCIQILPPHAIDGMSIFVDQHIGQ